MASSAKQPPGAGAGPGAMQPSFKNLIEETEFMLRKQRQKGADYKFREGPGRPTVLDARGELSSGDPIAAATMAATKGAASPKKDALGATATMGATSGSTSGAAPAGGLDDYDPKVAAEKEREALVAFIAAKRTDASRMQAEVVELQKRYESSKIDLAQLAYEDDVDSERQIGLRRMHELKHRIVHLDTSLEDTESYQRTLAHMIKRGQEEKLSHLATLKAFEDAIRVHRHELELSDGVLRQVNKSRDDEIAQLHKMQGDVKKYLSQLDRKLEARRQEVRASRDKAADRMRKMRAEAAMKAEAEGDLTAEQEKQLMDAASNLAHQQAELRAEKIRVQAEADAAETEYHRVRFAAGVPGPNGEAMVTDEGQQFPAPEPEPIIHRFAQLEDEVKQIEEQLADYSRRLNALQQQRAALQIANQPRALDAEDEADVDVTALENLASRTEVAKRAFEASNREYESARAMKLQLEQSINVLTERLALLPSEADINTTVTPELAEGDGIVSAHLAAFKQSLPTIWCEQLLEKTLAAVTRLQGLMRTIDPVAAAAALTDAIKMLQSSLSRIENAAIAAGGESGEYDTKEFESSDGASSRSAVAGSGSSSSSSATGASGGADANGEAGGESVEEMESDRRLDATIDSLVVQNEWSIRVRPGSSSGGSRPIKAISSKALTDASSAFAETFKQVQAGTYVNTADFTGLSSSRTGTAATGTHNNNNDDPLSKEGVRSRRRNSRVEITANFSAAAAAYSGNTEEDGLGSSSPRATMLITSKSTSKGGSKSAAAAAAVPEIKGPKGEVVKKILATAASMAGDEVEDARDISKKDTEEVVSREKMKRTVFVTPTSPTAVKGGSGKGESGAGGAK